MVFVADYSCEGSGGISPRFPNTCGVSSCQYSDNLNRPHDPQSIGFCKDSKSSGQIDNDRNKIRAVQNRKASGSIFPLGITVVNATATDDANNQATCGFRVEVLYNFSGFLPPIANAPTVNEVNAGRAIPIKFSLSGNKGLNIFAPGYPASRSLICANNLPISKVVETTTSQSGLSYDAASDTYTYVWKTEKLWEGTCRELIVKLNDGRERVAFFTFK